MKKRAQRSEPATSATRGAWPILVLFDAMGRSKALRIIWELRAARRLKFRELTAACEASPTVLNTRLKELRALGLVDHERPAGYFLTERGRELLAYLLPLWKWTQGFIQVRSKNGRAKIVP